MHKKAILSGALCLLMAGAVLAESSYPEIMARTQREIDLARKRQELDGLLRSGQVGEDLPRIVSIFSRNGTFFARVRTADGIERTVSAGDSISTHYSVHSISGTAVTVKAGKKLAVALDFASPGQPGAAGTHAIPGLPSMPPGGIPAPQVPR